MSTFNPEQYSAFTAIRMPCWEIFILLPTVIAEPFRAELFLVQPNNLLALLHGGFISWCRTLGLKFCHFLESPLAYFSVTSLNSSPNCRFLLLPLPCLRKHHLGLAAGTFSPGLLMKIWNIIVPWHLRKNSTSFRLQTVVSFEQFSQVFSPSVAHPCSPSLPSLAPRKQAQMNCGHQSPESVTLWQTAFHHLGVEESGVRNIFHQEDLHTENSSGLCFPVHQKKLTAFCSMTNSTCEGLIRPLFIWWTAQSNSQLVTKGSLGLWNLNFFVDLTQRDF